MTAAIPLLSQSDRQIAVGLVSSQYKSSCRGYAPVPLLHVVETPLQAPLTLSWYDDRNNKQQPTCVVIAAC